MTTHRPNAARFNCLHLNNESPEDSLIDGQHKTHEPATSQPLTKLHQPNIILGQVVDDVTGCVQLTQSKLVMILVVQNVQQVRKERVQVL